MKSNLIGKYVAFITIFEGAFTFFDYAKYTNRSVCRNKKEVKHEFNYLYK